MNTNSTRELGFSDYWNKRYDETTDNESVSHEWFRTFEKLRRFLQRELPCHQDNPRVLHLGCGDSTLPADLYDLQYKNQLSVDFSDVVIRQMHRKHPALEWQVGDVRDLQVADSCIDVAIDKGTLDAMIHGSQWDPPEEVSHNVRLYVDEVCRVLKPQGKWLYITYRQPHFVKPQLVREGKWTVRVENLEDGPGTFEYFAYVMTKNH